MPISEAARADLYTGLAEVLGPERAETLMTHLPSFDPSQVATKSDLASMEAATRADLARLGTGIDQRFEQVDKRFEQVDKRFEQVDKRFDQVDKRFEQFDIRMLGLDRRLDRLFLALLASLFVIVATMASVIFTVG